VNKGVPTDQSEQGENGNLFHRANFV
jgi:hypothetical protein